MNRSDALRRGILTEQKGAKMTMGKRNISVLLSLCLLLALGGCGSGGGDGDTPPPVTASAEGAWIGTTTGGRQVAGLVLDDGTYWIVYSVVTTGGFGAAGVVTGTSQITGNAFTSTDARDVNVDTQVVSDVTVAGTVVSKESLHATVTYTNPPDVVVASTSYDAVYELEPNLPQLAGKYTEFTYVGGVTGFSQIVISPTGVVTGTVDRASSPIIISANRPPIRDTCEIAGQLVPRAQGNVYDLEATFLRRIVTSPDPFFTPGNTTTTFVPCRLGLDAVKGVVAYDKTRRLILVASLNATKTDGFVLVGNRINP